MDTPSKSLLFLFAIGPSGKSIKKITDFGEGS